MTSTTLIKQEEQSIPLHLYTIASTRPSPEPQLTPHYIHSPLAKPTFIQQPFSFYSEVPLAKDVRGTPKYGYSSSFEQCDPIFPNTLGPPFVKNPITLPAVSTSSTPPTPYSSVARPRIPRPANAFMLFRSDFLKRGVIPSDVERRQQNLSRIVGEVWNMLDPAERAKWHERAAIALSEHQRKNPGYKFTPAPRGSRRNKSRGRGDPISDKPDNIRDIREKYVNIIGPSPPSVRKRRQQKTRSLDTEKQISSSPLFTAFNSRTPSFPPLSTKPHHVVRIDQSPPLTPYRSMMSFPEPSIPRRPSTSLGFHPPPKRNHISYGSPDLRISSTRPPSAASSTSGFLNYVRAHGEELSLAVDQFGSVSAPSSPPSYDRTVWTPYSTIGTSKNSEPIIAGTIDSTEHEEDLLSSSLYEPADDANLSTTAPVADTASSEDMDNYHPVAEVDPTTFFASFGFTDEMLASLTPASESMQVAPGESTGQIWLPSGSLSLEDWDLNVCPDNNVFSFTVGDL